MSGVMRRSLRAGRTLVLTLWRHLTSMRTALFLLFLLALGSLPGALLPQWYLNRGKTASYILEHPTLGPLLDRLGFFDVFGSPWYAAIYLLLAVSLVGCILPRSIELVQQWRAKPGRTPRNLGRLPHHARMTVDGSADDVTDEIRRRLRHRGIGGWRVAVRTEADGARTVSAERGYLREVGNLVFHFAVLGLLFTMAIGSLFGYTASKLVTVGTGFCSSQPVNYDNFAPGRMVDGTGMAPFCIDVEHFEAAYDTNGMAKYFRADVKIQSGAQAGTDQWTPTVLNVNDPLRISGQRLYLLGHGYVPTFSVTYPDGETRDYSAPFQPQDSMFTSDGVVKITDPPGYDADDLLDHQLAITGVFAPSGVVTDGVLSSAYPDLLAPAVAVQVYRGDLGMSSGQPQNIFSLDTEQVDKGVLVEVAEKNLTKGESLTLDDGTTITFTGAKEFVSLQTSYDPVQGWALVFAILLIAGILASLTIKRRRVWYRIRPVEEGEPRLGGDGAAGCTVEVGGLARTDRAGYGSEFDSLVALAGEERVDEATKEPVT